MPSPLSAEMTSSESSIAAVEPRQFAEERIVVIGEPVGDLVDHGEPRLPQHVGAPEDQDRAPESLLVERELRFVAGEPFALVEQFRDLEFPGQRALAPHFRRMGGEHRAHQRAIEKVAERARFDAHLARALKGVSERAGARRGAGDRMGAVAADMMLILGDVGEVREIAVGAHNRERLVGAQAVERRLELAPRARPRCRDGSGSRPGGSARPVRRPLRPPAPGRCRRGFARAGGCRRAGGRPCRNRPSGRRVRLWIRAVRAIGRIR